MKYLNALFIAAFVVLGAAAPAVAQDGVEQNPSSVNYTVGDLEKLDKLQLTDIYIAKLRRMNNIMSFIPFEKLDPQSPNDLKIPATGTNDKALKNLREERKSYNETIQASLNQLTPYADKQKIIESILFLQTMINKIELIGLGMNELGY